MIIIKLTAYYFEKIKVIKKNSTTLSFPTPTLAHTFAEKARIWAKFLTSHSHAHGQN